MEGIGEGIFPLHDFCGRLLSSGGAVEWGISLPTQLQRNFKFPGSCGGSLGVVLGSCCGLFPSTYLLGRPEELPNSYGEGLCGFWCCVCLKTPIRVNRELAGLSIKSYEGFCVLMMQGKPRSRERDPRDGRHTIGDALIRKKR